LAQRIKVYTEEILSEYQCGFRQGRSTADHIFTITQILEKSYEYNISLYQLYIDFKQAFDSIDLLQIIEAMKEFGIPAKLIALTKMTLSETYNKVKIQNKLSGSFRTECGIRQGDSLSILLFNIGLEKVMRNIEINPGGTVFSRTR
jgi:sorting nexin-29